MGHIEVTRDSSESVPKSHISTHPRWKQCPQFRVRISSPSTNDSKHIAHIGTSRRFVSVAAKRLLGISSRAFLATWRLAYLFYHAVTTLKCYTIFTCCASCIWDKKGIAREFSSQRSSFNPCEVVCGEWRNVPTCGLEEGSSTFVPLTDQFVIFCFRWNEPI